MNTRTTSASPTRSLPGGDVIGAGSHAGATVRRVRDRRRLVTGLGIVTSLACASCASFGAQELVSSHTHYNDAVQLTVAREVLANIVRARYADPMQFLAVSSINASFSVSAGGSAGVGGLGVAGAAGEAAGSVGYSASPTISYAPQSDAAFYKSLHNRLEVEEAIGFSLQYRFARPDSRRQRISLQLAFASVNGADDVVGGADGELYGRRIDAIARLLESGATYRQVPEWDFDSLAIPKDKVTAEDKVTAFEAGLYFVEQDGGQDVRLARYRLVVALTLPDPTDPEVTTALEVLGVPPGLRQYVLRPPSHAFPGRSDPNAIWVSPRSMVDVIDFAARWVEVPAEHVGIAPGLGGAVADASAIPTLRIRASSNEPGFPYRVQHRGCWFYIDDSDLESRMFLEAMVAAYSSRVGSKQAGDASPQLVLPVG